VWQARYDGDPKVIGRTVRVNSEPTTLVGVLPEGFRFPVTEDAWMPLVLETGTLERGEGTTLEVFGRLRDGASAVQAAREMSLIAHRLAEAYPKTNQGIGAVVKPYIREFVGRETVTLLGVMFAAVLLVLLIACFNVANLLLGRAALRGRELAIRSALGCGRWGTLGQVLSEAALISLLGAVFGIGLAHLGLRLFENHLAQVEVPFWFSFSLSPSVLLLVVGVTAAAALVAGLLPALQVARPQISAVLQDSSRGTTSLRLGWLSRTLVVLEVAISCALLIGAGLNVRSVLAAQSYDLRFDPHNLLTARMGLFEGDYPEEADWLRFYQQLHERLAARPEVESAAIGTVIPTDTAIGAGMMSFERPGETYESPRDMPLVRFTVISPGYFETLGVPLLAGRDFTAADRGGAPAVALVNQDFARKEWPGQNPLGQRVDLWMGEAEEREEPGAGRVEVVGVVPNLRFADFDNDDDQQGIYVPLAQNPVRFAWALTRTRTAPLTFADTLRRTVRDLDPNLPLYFVHSMDQVLERTLFYPRLIGVFFGIFAAVAIVLALVGLYGVLAFAVSQRTQEMGVRMALGAAARDIVALVLKQGLRQVAVGLAAGLLLSTGLALALAAFLFQVEPADPVTFVFVPLLLVAIALAACLLPARRASAVDPAVALRAE
jgi:predicted permease